MPGFDHTDKESPRARKVKTAVKVGTGIGAGILAMYGAHKAAQMTGFYDLFKDDGTPQDDVKIITGDDLPIPDVYVVNNTGTPEYRVEDGMGGQDVYEPAGNLSFIYNAILDPSAKDDFNSRFGNYNDSQWSGVEITPFADREGAKLRFIGNDTNSTEDEVFWVTSLDPEQYDMLIAKDLVEKYVSQETLDELDEQYEGRWLIDYSTFGVEQIPKLDADKDEVLKYTLGPSHLNENGSSSKIIENAKDVYFPMPRFDEINLTGKNFTSNVANTIAQMSNGTNGNLTNELIDFLLENKIITEEDSNSFKERLVQREKYNMVLEKARGDDDFKRFKWVTSVLPNGSTETSMYYQGVNENYNTGLIVPSGDSLAIYVDGKNDEDGRQMLQDWANIRDHKINKDSYIPSELEAISSRDEMQEKINTWEESTGLNVYQVDLTGDPLFTGTFDKIDEYYKGTDKEKSAENMTDMFRGLIDTLTDENQTVDEIFILDTHTDKRGHSGYVFMKGSYVVGEGQKESGFRAAFSLTEEEMRLFQDREAGVYDTE